MLEFAGNVLGLIGSLHRRKKKSVEAIFGPASVLLDESNRGLHYCHKPSFFCVLG